MAGEAWNRVWIGLGANLGDRRAMIERAVERLERHEGLRWGKLSTLRETEPVGGPAQGPYLNAAAELETRLGPRPLLDLLLSVEAGLGRRRRERNGPRPIDLDILVYGDLRVDEEGLVIPHPRMAGRGFVLEPLAEIAPDVVHPVTGRTFRQMWDEFRALATGPDGGRGCA